MKIILASIIIVIIPFTSMAAQYCQEVDAKNLEHIQTVVDLVNAREGTQLDIATFMSETIKDRVTGEIARDVNSRAAAAVEEAAATRAQIQAAAGAEFDAKRAEIEETW
ncbi:MAG: hypothetical protein P8N94_02600 [Gammaproteobacteria bacterium]|nr:hypothetical protein [Gammaproteobacteria bacterium]